MKNPLLQIHLGLTSRCNLNCPHCYRKQYSNGYTQKTQNSDMPIEKAFNILTNAKNLGLFKVVLIYGEPLLYPEIFKFIRWCVKNDLDVEVATNATLLNEKIINKLFHSGLTKIHISLDFPDERHDVFRGMTGIFNRILNSLSVLKKYPIRVKLVSTMMVNDYASYLKLLKIAEKYKVSSLYFIPPNLKPNNSQNFKKTYYHNLKKMLINICRLISDNTGPTKIYIHEPLYPKICGHNIGWEECLIGKILHITPFGDVTMCPFSQHVFGNIFNEPLTNIWDKITKFTISRFSIINKECLARLEKWKKTL